MVVLCGEKVRSDILWLIPEEGFERQMKVVPTGASASMCRTGFAEICALASSAYGCVYKPLPVTYLDSHTNDPVTSLMSGYFLQARSRNVNV